MTAGAERFFSRPQTLSSEEPYPPNERVSLVTA